MANEDNANGGAGAPTPANAIVHVREDSNKSLEELFAPVMNQKNAQIPLQVPMKMRNLPASFWRPPAQGSRSPMHSRESSIDNTLCGGMGGPFSPDGSVGSPTSSGGMLAPPSNNVVSSLQQQPNHGRTKSSPATLQQTLAVAQAQQQAQQQQAQAQQQQAQQQQPALHLRQASYDPGDGLGPLPAGWEMAKTEQGQVYFMNHINKTTCWDDPRKSTSQQQLAQQQAFAQNGNRAPAPPPQPSNFQSAAIVHQRSNSTTAVYPSTVGGMTNDNLGPLGPGWEQNVTEQGEVYFIDHINKKTSWFDPRIPIQNQRVPIRVNPQQQQQLVQQQQQHGGNLQPGTMEYQQQQRREQELRLQRLESEKLHLQKQQAKLKRQMEMRQRSASHDNMQAAMNQTQEMLMRQSLGEQPSQGNQQHAAMAGGADPFLGGNQQNNQNNENHNRQESADSGVGGMGSNFNLVSIPEVDNDAAMETCDTQGAAASSTTGGRTAASNGDEPMDSMDGVMPTLPEELNDVLPSDLMQEPVPTWL